MEKRDDKRLDPVLSWVLGGDKQTEQHSRELVRGRFVKTEEERGRFDS